MLPNLILVQISSFSSNSAFLAELSIEIEPSRKHKGTRDRGEFSLNSADSCWIQLRNRTLAKTQRNQRSSRIQLNSAPKAGSSQKPKGTKTEQNSSKIPAELINYPGFRRFWLMYNCFEYKVCSAWIQLGFCSFVFSRKICFRVEFSLNLSWIWSQKKHAGTPQFSFLLQFS